MIVELRLKTWCQWRSERKRDEHRSLAFAGIYLIFISLDHVSWKLINGKQKGFIFFFFSFLLLFSDQPWCSNVISEFSSISLDHSIGVKVEHVVVYLHWHSGLAGVCVNYFCFVFSSSSRIHKLCKLNQYITLQCQYSFTFNFCFRNVNWHVYTLIRLSY